MTSEPVTSASAASALLSLCGLFADADPEALGELASELQLVSVKRGELLICQGNPADCMYTIVSGRLEVTALALASRFGPSLRPQLSKTMSCASRILPIIARG